MNKENIVEAFSGLTDLQKELIKIINEKCPTDYGINKSNCFKWNCDECWINALEEEISFSKKGDSNE